MVNVKHNGQGAAFTHTQPAVILGSHLSPSLLPVARTAEGKVVSKARAAQVSVTYKHSRIARITIH